jgi:DNA-binding PucR family transcriptional regulator
VGAACRDPSEVTRSYREARRAVQAALSLGRAGQVVAFDKLGIYRLLLLVPDLRELTSVSREVLGPVLDYEQAHQANLVGTLTAYLQHNGSLQGAAQELHVHPNTVGYRLRRIEEITQLDLANADDRLMIQVALKILEGLPRTEERHHGR